MNVSLWCLSHDTLCTASPSECRPWCYTPMCVSVCWVLGIGMGNSMLQEAHEFLLCYEALLDDLGPATISQPNLSHVVVVNIELWDGDGCCVKAPYAYRGLLFTNAFFMALFTNPALRNGAHLLIQRCVPEGVKRLSQCLHLWINMT